MKNIKKEDLPKTLQKYYDFISDAWQEQDGDQFGVGEWRCSWWIELERGYATIDGLEQIHELTLRECVNELKHLKYREELTK